MAFSVDTMQVPILSHTQGEANDPQVGLPLAIMASSEPPLQYKLQLEN